MFPAMTGIMLLFYVVKTFWCIRHEECIASSEIFLHFGIPSKPIFEQDMGVISPYHNCYKIMNIGRHAQLTENMLISLQFEMCIDDWL